jgi:hypothetical protein
MVRTLVSISKEAYSAGVNCAVTHFHSRNAAGYPSDTLDLCRAPSAGVLFEQCGSVGSPAEQYGLCALTFLMHSEYLGQSPRPREKAVSSRSFGP